MKGKFNNSLIGTLALICNTIVHMFIAVIFLFIIYYAVVFSNTNESLCLHIVFQTLGYQFLMMEAIMTFQLENSWSSLLSKKNKKLVHLFLQVIGCGFIIAGFIESIILKNNMNSSHFTSNHGILGLVAFIFSMISLINGFVTFLMSPGGVRSTAMKMQHTFTGMMAIVMGLVSLILGINKPSFIKNTGETLYIVSTVFLSICTFYIIIRPLMNIRAYFISMRNAT